MENRPRRDTLCARRALIGRRESRVARGLDVPPPPSRRPPSLDFPSSVSLRSPLSQRVIAASGTSLSFASTTSAPADGSHPRLGETTGRMRTGSTLIKIAIKTAFVLDTNHGIYEPS